MTSDLARDPVFGEVARALQGRARLLGRPGRPIANAGTLNATFRSHGLSREDRAELERHPHVRIAALGSGREQVFGPQSAFVSDRPSFRALLEAERLVRARPGALRLMGVVNVTSDSFSDGGRFLDPARAIEFGRTLVAEGADLLDVGGESTRPGAEPVALDEELRRVVPVVLGLARATRVPISIDTTKAGVARAALEAGATIVNDVSAGLADPAMLGLVAERRAGYVAMHMRGEPRTMQAAPRYDDVVTDVVEFLRERAFAALQAGVRRETLWIDPGIGFGKTLDHNLALLANLGEIRSLGLPILLGVSRKSFITRITGQDTPPERRVGGTAAAVAFGVLGGAEILRVHDVAVMREAALVARAIAGDDAADDPA